MYFKIKTDIYPFMLLVFVDETDSYVFNKLKNRNNTIDDCNKLINFSNLTAGRTVLLESNDLVIRLNSFPNKYTMLGIIHHEVMHASFFIMDRIGAEYTKYGTNEHFTYLGEHIFKELCKKIKI